MIIALEGSSADASVALADPNGALLALDTVPAAERGDGRGGDLLVRLQHLLEAGGHRFEDVSAIAVGIGPGSFTGLRVTMGLAKGLAVGLERPLLGIPSLAAWLEAEPEATVAVSRAGSRDLWLLARGDELPQAIPLAEEALAALRSTPSVAPRELASALGLSGSRPPERAAAAVALLAAAELANRPQGDDLERLEPLYLRSPGIGPSLGATGGAR